jgi:hypothetical protein
MIRKLPIGIEDYKEMIDYNYYYVDKTLLIRELLATRSKNNLFLRPRRFGKTLLLSTLKYFFEDTGNEERNTKNRALFAGMKIMDEPEEYRAGMTSFPVISLSLKSMKRGSYAGAVGKLILDVSWEFYRHRDLLSHISNEVDIRLFNRFLNREGTDEEYSTSLQFLCRCLYEAYGKNVIILIDEYDVPLENAYFCGYYEEMISFIRSLFESALKTNPYLEFSVITGCMRISKESLFTGLNNLKVVSILNKSYGEYYGFVQEEVDEMLDYYGVTKRREDLRLWSDGFRFGRASVYNPWSVLSSVDDLKTDIDEFLKPQWANTSSNAIVKTLVEGADGEVRAEIEKLIAGETVEKPIHEEVTYSEMKKNGDNLWNFLFFTGYLTLKGLRQQGVHLWAELCIPNGEVLYIYETIINEWSNDKIQSRDLSSLHKAILTGDKKVVVKALQGIFQETISYFDYAENYYHGFLSGLMAKIPKYLVRSNRESGIGRTDIVLVPDDHDDSVVIIEFKVTKIAADIASKAAEALAQIASRNYMAEWREEGYKKFLLYGLAFYKKTVHIVSANESSLKKIQTDSKSSKNHAKYGGVNCTLTEIAVLHFLKETPSAGYADIAGAIGKSTRTAQTLVRSLKGKGLLTREGTRSPWIVKQPDLT